MDDLVQSEALATGGAAHELEAGSTSSPLLRGAALAIGILFVLSIAWIAHLESSGPSHMSFDLPGNEPATIYLPGEGNLFFRAAPPSGERPAAVVLVHGYTADRQIMSSLARRITQNGYAVLTIDVHGHGANRNPFANERENGILDHDIKQAVDFLRQYDMVDGSRIVVMGHSMGAGAALGYAVHDPSLKGSVMISGGWGLGTERPKNALFIFAQNDPEMIKTISAQLASKLAGVAQIEPSKLFGDFHQGNATEVVEVPGVNHATILYSQDAARTIVSWLDSVFGTKRTGGIMLSDPRLSAVIVALILFIALLIPVGRLSGSMTRAWPQLGDAGGWTGLLILVGAFVAAMPLVSMVPPVAFVPLEIGQEQLSLFAVAGLIMIGFLAITGRLARFQIGAGLGSVLAVAGFAFVVVYVCQGVTSLTLHRMAFTPERLVFWVLAMLVLLPFWLGFELLIRRGRVVMSTVRASIGRALILLLMAIAAALEILPPVLMLVLPTLIILFVMIEVFAASAYATSRNLTLIALVEAAWFGWTIAATNPITFMF